MLFMQLLISPLILQPLYGQQINIQLNAYLINKSQLHNTLLSLSNCKGNNCQ